MPNAFCCNFWWLCLVFRQSASYRVYLNGRRCGKGLTRDELKLWWANKFGDSSQMANVVAKYTNKSSFTTRILHLEGQ
jgi:hypothetical protein